MYIVLIVDWYAQKMGKKSRKMSRDSKGASEIDKEKWGNSNI